MSHLIGISLRFVVVFTLVFGLERFHAHPVALAQDRPADGLFSTLADEGEVIAKRVYQLGAWFKRVPYDLAMPVIARGKLRDYVNRVRREGGLERDVYERVMSRIDSTGLVDELIPFLLVLKDSYVASTDVSRKNFDSHFRSRFSSETSPPGTEHSLFSWKPQSKEKGFGGFEVDGILASKFITLFDSVFLKRKKVSDEIDDRLRCDRDFTLAEMRLQAVEVQPQMDSTIRLIADRLAGKVHVEGQDVPGMVRRFLDDPNRVQALTLSLIEFLKQQVCKHYYIFAARAVREQQLRSWLRAEIDRPGGGELWKYLEYANNGRRYGVQMVVDGLQGHLIQALAGQPGDRFLAEMLKAHRNSRGMAPERLVPEQKSTPTPAQQIRFLEFLNGPGKNYAHPDYLPFLRDLFNGRHWGIARSGVSTTPTISVRNLPIAKTGAPVAGDGGTEIPNFHWVDREWSNARGRPYYFFGNDALELERLAHRGGKGMRTMFDRLAHLRTMNCGAQYDRLAQFTVDSFLNLGIGEKVRDFGDILCMRELDRRADNEVLLRQKREKLLEKRARVQNGRFLSKRAALELIDEIAALEQEAMPEFLLYYNPWPDHFAHFAGPFSDEVLAPSGELNRLDYWLGRMRDAYVRAGVIDRAVFGMAGDHGLTPVFHALNPEVEIFDRLRDSGIDFSVMKISSDEGEGPKMNNAVNPPEVRGKDVVVASTAGGNYMLDFFKDQSKDWGIQPVYSDLTAFVPVKHRGDPDFKPVDIVAEAYSRLSASLDYLVVREEPCGQDGGKIRLVGGRPRTLAGRDGTMITQIIRYDAWIERRGDRMHYSFPAAESNAGDLLDTHVLTPFRELTPAEKSLHERLRFKCVHAAKPGDEKTWCTEDEWRLMTSFTPRPDSVVQLAHLYDTSKAGTINLFPKEGVGYNTKVPGRHAGEHFHEKDAFVGVWGVPVRRNAVQGQIPTAVNGSMPLAIYEYLTHRRFNSAEDRKAEGWGYPSLGDALFGERK